MKFTERKEFLTDPELFGRNDVLIAQRLHAEYTKTHSPKPFPKFFEVDRDESKYDDLWHAPVNRRMQYSRSLDVPCLNKFIKPDWRLTNIGLIAQRRDDFIISYLVLKELDYFPVRGDGVYWNGYRYIILNAVLDPESYWQQTNAWTGMRVECVIQADGDAAPIENPGKLSRSETHSGNSVAKSKTTLL